MYIHMCDVRSVSASSTCTLTTHTLTSGVNIPWVLYKYVKSKYWVWNCKPVACDGVPPPKCQNIFPAHCRPVKTPHEPSCIFNFSKEETWSRAELIESPQTCAPHVPVHPDLVSEDQYMYVLLVMCLNCKI